MDLVYLLRVLLKRKWLILGAGFLAALVAFFATMEMKKNYKSFTRLSTGFSVSDEINVNEDNVNLLETDVKFNNIIVTCLSPSFINLLSCRLILHDMTSDKPFRVLDDDAKKSPVYQAVNKNEAVKVYRQKLETLSILTSYNPEEKKLLELLKLYGYDFTGIMRGLSIYRLQRTDYLQIDFTSENPELSAYVANATYQQLISYYGLQRSNKSQESIDTLRSLMEKRKAELDAKNSLLRSEGLIDVSMESSSKLDVITDLEKVLTEEKSKQTSLSYELRKVNQRIANISTPGKTLPPDASNDEILLLKKSMNEAYMAYVNDGSKDKSLLNRYNQLKSQYQDKIINLQSRSTDDNNTGSVTKSSLLDRKNDIETDVMASTANIATIEAKINILKGNIQQNASKGAMVETLRKDAELSTKEYLAAKQKYNDAIDVTSTVNNLRQIAIAQPAIEPEPSKRLLIVGLGGTGAFLTTILVLVFMTYMDSSIKSPTIFTKTMNLKMISMINFADLKSHTIKEVVMSEANDGLNKLQKGNKRHNVFRESLRKLRYEIERSGKKIFLFTSTKKGQGKTTIIQAIAYSLSVNNKKVLVIDTNFCNNDLTIQMEGKPVFENIELANKDNNAVLQEVRNASKKVEGENIFILGCEGGDYTPSEVLKGENILKYLQLLTTEYDYIFLEGPPLNDFTDSKELASYVEGIIGVFSAGQTVKEIDKQSAAFFTDSKDKFLGAVLNMVDLEDINAD